MTPEVDAKLVLNAEGVQALTHIGDVWALLILRDVFLGWRRFEELRRSTGAARGTLTARLKSLVEKDILYRNPYSDKPVRYEYRLTEKGLDLYPAMLAVWSWEKRWGGDETDLPELHHESCGQPTHPEFHCGHCDVAVHPHEVSYRLGCRHFATTEVPPRFQRRTKKRRVVSDGEQKNVHFLDIVGNRWTALVHAAVYFGINRYDDIGKTLGIATNILADRLKLLVDGDFFERRRYQEQPIRHDYHLTEKSHDLYSYAISIHEWADKWLIEKGREPLLLTHEPCGKRLKTRAMCNVCQGELHPWDVSTDKNT